MSDVVDNKDEMRWENLLHCILNPVFSSSACEESAGSSLWIYVFIGNMMRGIGETPIMPLGISYLDDFSREENTPFYLGWLIFTLHCLR